MNFLNLHRATIFLLFFHGLYASSPLKLTYSISPAKYPDLCKVHVKAFPESSSTITLQVPMPENVSVIREIFVTSNLLITPNKDGEVLLTFQKNQPLNFTYVVKGVSREEQHWYLLPQGEESYFHIFGDHLFVYPKDATEAEIDLEWTGWPDNWLIANSLGVEKRNQFFSGALDTFLTTIFIGGDFQTFATEGPFPITLATRGSLVPNGPDLLKKIKMIIHEQRSFWNDEEFPFFLITVLPLGSAEVCCGRGFFQSFSICANDFSMNNPEELLHTISHEHFHTWNGMMMKALPYPNTIWFSEGFTDYYAAKLNLSSGIIDEAYFIGKINAYIYRYLTSPVKNYTNQQVIAEYRLDDKVWDIDYYRGALLAAIWDHEIKRSTGNQKNLDDFMRMLFLEAKESNGEISQENILQIASNFLDQETILDLQRYVLDGLEMPVREKLAFPGWSFEGITSSEFHEKFGFPLLDEEIKIPQLVPEKKTKLSPKRPIRF